MQQNKNKKYLLVHFLGDGRKPEETDKQTHKLHRDSNTSYVNLFLCLFYSPESSREYLSNGVLVVSTVWIKAMQSTCKAQHHTFHILIND